ncbi:glycine--tRNA ligase subunit beta [Desulfurispira natronophila]|uniref:Glycine--tRNA ligase beta subunit n=1 Tax=Desulfurispira natronophila TaxID=682562 RepID=A0A7W8DGT5_9BACT|nr:glycine--tRNA ligase subunit beta [Desulfurispira natronophila]MBB5021704.1 glycyl-tRNA synthetase beta chain [Desulfurispira natronophila]
MSNHILLELGTEEIPAGFIDTALQHLAAALEKGLKQQRIAYQSAITMGTPRRLSVLVQEVAGSGENVEQEVVGPAKSVAYDNSGDLSKAGAGFLRSKGFAPEDAYIKQTAKGEYLAAMQRQEGVDTASILPEILWETLNSLHFRKSMRWGSGSLRFARPLRHIVALWNDEVVPLEFHGLQANNLSTGHRFLGAPQVKVSSPLTYASEMENELVIVDISHRRQLVEDQCNAIAAQYGGKPVGGDALIKETAHLVEYPVAVAGSFDEHFLQLPRELLVTTMREHQKYFAVAAEDGSLLPYFITISNMPIDDHSTIRQGNERVLRARLSDADFYFAEDLKTPLADRKNQLNKVVFQEQLGTIGQKVDRITLNTKILAQSVNMESNRSRAALTLASLCKCDLVSGMVFEFPELQGIMGKEYAQREGYDDVVSQGIMEHWYPRFAGDELPSTLEAALVSIADKMDTIVGCFGIGLLPSSSNDPYALRRQSLGILHTLTHWEIDLPLESIVRLAQQALQPVLTREGEVVVTDVVSFIVQRCKIFFTTTKGFDHDVVDSVFSSSFDDVVTVSRKLSALQELKQSSDYRDVVETFRRAVNIIPTGFGAQLHAEQLSHDSEVALLQKIETCRPMLQEAVSNRDFQRFFNLTREIKPAVDNLFEQVMVMDSDLSVRNNRLALLQMVGALFKDVADFSKLVVD